MDFMGFNLVVNHASITQVTLTESVSAAAQMTECQFDTDGIIFLLSSDTDYNL